MNFSHFAECTNVCLLVASRPGIGDLVSGLPKARAALAFAEQSHAGQRRTADGAPFILHPIEVATLLHRAGAPDHVIAAGLLHDVIEKTDVDAGQLRRRFGARVTTIVLAVTEDEGVSGYHARKAALRRQAAAAGEDALTVFAADKISKARELRPVPRLVGLRSDGHDDRARRRKLTHYRRSLTLLETLLPDSPLVEQLRSELHRLAAREPMPRTLAGAA